jgi:hypothetical protein
MLENLEIFFRIFSPITKHDRKHRKYFFLIFKQLSTFGSRFTSTFAIIRIVRYLAFFRRRRRPFCL